MKLPRPHCLAGAALLAAAACAQAHDTWFEPRPAAQGTLLALGTGNQFPRQESGIDARYLVRQGCRAGSGAALPLQPLADAEAALLLRAAAGAATCWAQLTPFEVELAPDKIEIYLRDIGAGPELRATWAAMHARGLPWKERYTKHARVELGGGQPEPSGMDVDARLLTPGPARAGEPLSFEVLRQGRPLAGLPVELRSEASPFGLWRRTDAQGRVQLAAPLPGRWVLRAVDLRPSEARPGTWDSDFITLAFGVLPALQNGSSFRSNALSTNQAAATAVISSEPPHSTTRR